MIIPASLPHNPGVYLFKDNEGKIIYIGKANNLKKRVSSYSLAKDHSAKTQILIKHIEQVEFIVVDNEVEALLLENKLIKEHSPRYNISLKDSKTYAYLMITDEPYPKIATTRIAKGKGHFFGPYTDGLARRQVLNLVLQLFQLRVCKKLPKKECLNYHIGLCTAPCIGKVAKEEYQKKVDKAISFLKGNVQEIIDYLKKEMFQAAEKQEYEKALKIKRQMESIELVQHKQKVDLLTKYDQDVVTKTKKDSKAIFEIISIVRGVIRGKKEFIIEEEEESFEKFITLYYATAPIPSEIIVNEIFWRGEHNKIILEEYFKKIKGSNVTLTYPIRGEKRALVELGEKNALASIENKTLKELQEKLILPTLPLIIECFDISNLGSKFVVAGMTRFVSGKPDKEGYRRFEMKSVDGQDDFAAMHEAVFRRYKRLSDEKKELPDLIVIDGGKGQLSVSLSALRELSLQIPIIALAKEYEEIYLPEEENSRRFSLNSPMMLLLRQIRDSTHNFVISYNRKKRGMEFREETK